jgi:hypothetical protein
MPTIKNELTLEPEKYESALRTAWKENRPEGIYNTELPFVLRDGMKPGEIDVARGGRFVTIRNPEEMAQALGVLLKP